MSFADVRTPQPVTLTHGRFVYLADRACAADLRYDRTLKPATSPDTFVKDVRLSIKSGEHLIFVLRGLTPPPYEAAAFRRFLAAENGSDRVATHLLDSYGNTTLRSFRHDVHRLRILDRRIRSRAAKLGMHVCAKD